MSVERVRDWLQSYSSEEKRYQGRPGNRHFNSRKKLNRSAFTISVTSGKGGVGKTSIALKNAELLSAWGYRVLLIDCDFNLSNTLVKLNEPIGSKFVSFLNKEISFADAIVKRGNLHILPSCNGDTTLFEKEFEFEKIIIDIIVNCESDYDFIILDSPAGLSKTTLTLNAYCDYRLVVVTPDKSSLTDSYSLMKILKYGYGIQENHLIINKVTNIKQYQRMIKILSETVENFLQCRLGIIGGIERENCGPEKFDHILLKEVNSSLHKNFIKLLKKFTDRYVDVSSYSNSKEELDLTYLNDGHEQDVQSTIS